MVACEIEDLGRAAYTATLDRMRARHTEVAAGRHPGSIWLVEHDPVYTAGRATPRDEHPPTGDVPLVAIERGGKITYHGPGQLVIYPIVRLPRRDVHDWLRRLEAFGVAVCAALGIGARPSIDGTGVFAAGRKVGSIGVAVKHWTNLHGISLNIAMDHAPWQRVRPCGLSPDMISDLASIAGRPIAIADAKQAARDAVFVLTGAGDPL